MGGTNLSVFFILFAALFIPWGMWMLARGRWPRRTGTTPHCPRCDYIVGGLETDRCPECGTAIHPGNVILGERFRRPKLVISGLLLMLLGMIPLGVAIVASMANIQWINYRPAGWLINDLDSPLTADPAWNELTRRMKLKGLGESKLARLTDQILQYQKQPAARRYASEASMFEFLNQRYTEGKMSAAQKDQFFDSGLKVTVETRPVIGTKDGLPYWVRAVGRGPNGWWIRSRRVEWHIDDGPSQPVDNGYGGYGSFGGGASGSTIDAKVSVGKHKLHTKIELSAAHSGASQDGPFDRVIVRDLDSDFTVVPDHAPIATITTPAPEVLKPLFQFHLEATRSYLSINVDLSAAPVDMAFDLIMVTGGKEHRAGSVNFTKNTASGFGTGDSLGAKYPTPFPGHVDIILRSSEDVARGTTQLTQIWKGEILFKDVPVALPATNPTRPVSSAP